MIFESKLGQKNTFLKLKSGQKIKKKKKCPKTEFLSQIWAKMAKNGPKKNIVKAKIGAKVAKYMQKLKKTKKRGKNGAKNKQKIYSKRLKIGKKKKFLNWKI